MFTYFSSKSIFFKLGFLVKADSWKNLISDSTEKCDFIQSLLSLAECYTRSILLSRVQLAWIQSFSSPRLVALAMPKNLVYPTTYHRPIGGALNWMTVTLAQS